MAKFLQSIFFASSISFAFAAEVSADAPFSITAWLDEIRQGAPHLLIEALLLLIILYVLFQKRFKPSRTQHEKLTEEEIDQMVEEWQPQPLVTPTHQNTFESRQPVIQSEPASHIVIDGQRVINLATTNFLGLVETPEIKEVASSALKKYGVGSCGPRGFYGTIDTHLDLEKELAKFMNTEAAIIFSSGYVTLSSTVPSFSGREDIIVVDKGVNHAIKTGLSLSRSEIHWFEHNDVADLERILSTIKNEDARTKRKLTRRLLIVEGVYINSGDVAPLPKILELKEKYFWRVLLDDSYGFGVLGKTGRGTLEHYGLPSKSVEMLIADMGHSLASVGGFCCGEESTIYHQRLNSSGYVFSASSPPYLTAVAREALRMIDAQPQRLEKLRRNAKKLREGLKASLQGVEVTGDAETPIIHLRRQHSKGSRLADDMYWQEVVDKAFSTGLGISRAKYEQSEKFIPVPSIRLFVSANHEEKTLDEAITILTKVINNPTA